MKHIVMPTIVVLALCSLELNAGGPRKGCSTGRCNHDAYSPMVATDLPGSCQQCANPYAFGLWSNYCNERQLADLKKYSKLSRRMARAANRSPCTDGSCGSHDACAHGSCGHGSCATGACAAGTCAGGHHTAISPSIPCAAKKVPTKFADAEKSSSKPGIAFKTRVKKAPRPNWLQAQDDTTNRPQLDFVVVKPIGPKPESNVASKAAARNAKSVLRHKQADRLSRSN